MLLACPFREQSRVSPAEAVRRTAVQLEPLTAGGKDQRNDEDDDDGTQSYREVTAARRAS